MNAVPSTDLLGKGIYFVTIKHVMTLQVLSAHRFQSYWQNWRTRSLKSRFGSNFFVSHGVSLVCLNHAFASVEDTGKPQEVLIGEDTLTTRVLLSYSLPRSPWGLLDVRLSRFLCEIGLQAYVDNALSIMHFRRGIPNPMRPVVLN